MNFFWIWKQSICDRVTAESWALVDSPYVRTYFGYLKYWAEWHLWSGCLVSSVSKSGVCAYPNRVMQVLVKALDPQRTRPYAANAARLSTSVGGGQFEMVAHLAQTYVACEVLGLWRRCEVAYRRCCGQTAPTVFSLSHLLSLIRVHCSFPRHPNAESSLLVAFCVPETVGRLIVGCAPPAAVHLERQIPPAVTPPSPQHSTLSFLHQQLLPSSFLHQTSGINLRR